MNIKSIEEEIKTTFRNDQHKLIVNIFFTYFKILNQSRQQFVDYDITLQQFNVLRILRGQKGNPVSIQLIKDRVMDKNSDVSRLVKRLKEKGFILESENSSDRRKKDITISQSGLDLLDKLGNIHESTESLLDHLTPQELNLLNDLLDKTRINMN